MAQNLLLACRVYCTFSGIFAEAVDVASWDIEQRQYPLDGAIGEA